MRYFAPLIVLSTFLVACHGKGDSSESAGALVQNDYSAPENWLCFPGRLQQPCAADLSTTVIEADGTTRVENFQPDPDPAIDCFYVYPTVSRQSGPIADLVAGPEERYVAKHQVARLAERCRIYAPLYRQMTRRALAAELLGRPLPGSDTPAIRDAGYEDIKAAWRYYLDHENHGRGVVLMGHSQGSKLLVRLIKEEIDGKPSQALLISAILPGTNLLVPRDAPVGGDFKAIPLCQRAEEIGCTITFVSFREDLPPPKDVLFGRPRKREPGMVTACVNPAALTGGSAELHAYFASGAGARAGADSERGRWAKDLAVNTPFVSLPGLLTARCVTDDDLNYLAVRVNPAQKDVRTNEIPGDLVVGGVVLHDWGLHMVDVSLVLGNLLDVVRQQSATWLARKS